MDIGNAHPKRTSNHRKHMNESSTDNASITRLNRESAIALGILLFLILLAISWFATSRIRQHKAACREADARRLTACTNHRPSQRGSPSSPANGITGYRIFKVDQDVSRKGWQYWVGREGEAYGRGESMCTLPRYEARARSNSIGAVSERERQKWWDSVAGTSADVELLPLPSSPTRENHAYPSPLRPPIAGGFHSGVWQNERVGCGLDATGQLSTRQERVDAPSSPNDQIENGIPEKGLE